MPKKSYYIIGFILFLALLLRLWGTDFGLPYFLVNDERALVYGALKMGELKTLIPALHPQEFDILNPKYNVLMSYVYLFSLTPFILIKYFIGNFQNFTELGNYFILNPSFLWLIARIVTVLIGTGTVYLVYLIGRKMFGYSVGLLAALFLALSFLHVQLSHFARPWAPMVFFVSLIMLLSPYIRQSPQKKYYLLAGVAGGLAFGVSPGSLFFMFIFVLAHFLTTGSFARKLKDKNLWLSLLVFVPLVLFFILTNPRSFWVLGFGEESLTTPKSIVNYLQIFVSYFKLIFFSEPVISIFSLLGIIFFWFKSKKMVLLVLSWPIFYISTLYFINYTEFMEAEIQNRYMTVVIPWLAILAGFAADRLTAKLQNPVKAILIFLIFIFPFGAALQYDWLLNQRDTRVLALEWVEENISAGAKIISNWSSVNPSPTKEAILFQKELDGKSLRVADQVLLNLSDKDYPRPAYNILKLAYIDKEKWVVPQDAQYFLAAFWKEQDLSAEERALIQSAELVKEFKQGQLEKPEDINDNFLRPVSILFSLERFGPTVRIYQIK